MVALAAAKAAPVVPSATGNELLGFEDLARAARTAGYVARCGLDTSGVDRTDGTGTGFVAEAEREEGLQFMSIAISRWLRGFKYKIWKLFRSSSYRSLTQDSIQ